MKIRKFVFRAPEDDGASAGGESTQETIGTGNDARLALLNGINDTLDAERADELAHVNDDGTTEPFQAAAPDVVDPEDDPTASPANAEEPAAAAPAKIKIKVNGRELELTQEELIARAQKVESADEYLRTAKQTAKPAPVAQPSQEELQRQQDEEDRALVRAIQMGTEEEATAAIRKLKSQTSTRPSISTDDVSRTVDERLAFNASLTAFRTEYKDIVTDPFLNKLALDRDAELLAAGDARPYAERYTEIGETLRAWKSSLAKDVHPAVSDQTKKEEKKALAPKVPTAAAGKQKPAPQEDDTDESPSSVIQAMREKRGGPQWMRN
jgi:hypothetical protein